MHNTLAMVLAGGRVDELSVLTLNRPKSAVPFGGLYRVIDFPLSNLMHSVVQHVGILSQYRPFSLMNHISNGAAWDMFGRHRNIHILPPFKGHQPSDWYRGTADAIHQNMDFVRMVGADRVLILSGDHIYKMDYNELENFHLKHGADLTVAFVKVPLQQASRFGLGKIADDEAAGGRLIDYAEKPENPISEWASLTIYLFRQNVLTEVVERAVEREGKYEFGRDIIPQMIKNYKVFGYKFVGFWGYTRTLEEYYNTSMSLLGDQPEWDPEDWQVRTNLAHRRLQDRPPAFVGSSAVVDNSLIYNGCKIFGEVTNCILFPGVAVAAGAKLRDSIIMFDTEIGENAIINKAIIDTDTRIGSNTYIGKGSGSVRKQNFSTVTNAELVLIGEHVTLPEHITLSQGCRVFPYLPAAHFTEKYYAPQEVIR